MWNAEASEGEREPHWDIESNWNEVETIEYEYCGTWNCRASINSIIMLASLIRLHYNLKIVLSISKNNKIWICLPSTQAAKGQIICEFEYKFWVWRCLESRLFSDEMRCVSVPTHPTVRHMPFRRVEVGGYCIVFHHRKHHKRNFQFKFTTIWSARVQNP